MKNGSRQDVDVVVVGGGLAGLAAAAYLARAGRAVIVLERSGHVGGRAITQERSGFYFNLGPHALYRTGAGGKILRELGVETSGGQPPVESQALYRGALERLPASPWSLLTTGLLGLSAKIEYGRLFAGLAKIDPAPLHHVSLEQWLAANVRHQPVSELMRAIVRLTSYANDPERISAGFAIAQAQLALEGVDYLDGGWQTLVDGLRRAAEAAGARVVTGARVAMIERDEAIRRVRLEDGSTLTPSSVIIAAAPKVAAELVERSHQTALRAWANDAVPIRAATLDLGLRRLPNPGARFVLGVARPLYLSVHSTVARLAPEDGAMIHVAKYLAPDADGDPKTVERELEELLDLAQPGWRDLVVERRFLPNLVVVNDLATADRSGLTGRPGPEVPRVSNLYVAGDWVGSEGWLSDASLASAQRAAESILRKSATQAPTASSVAAVGTTGR